MKLSTSIVCFYLLLLAQCIIAQESNNPLDVARYIIEQVEEFPHSKGALLEVDSLLKKNIDLSARLLAEDGRISVNKNILWEAARQSDFDIETLHKTYPFLADYGNILFLSPTELGAKRVIYQTAIQKSLGDVTMLFEKDKQPQEAPILRVGPWRDEDGLTAFRGRIFNYIKRNNRHYLYSVSEGRLTTGSSDIRHVLYWLRIEADKLVPERFEAYDVPVGVERNESHLKTVSLPENPVNPESSADNEFEPRKNNPESNFNAPDSFGDLKKLDSRNEANRARIVTITVMIIAIAAACLFLISKKKKS